MASGPGISFLYEFDLGNRDVLNPGSKILSVTSTALGDFDKANLTTDSTRHRWRSSDALVAQEIIIQADISSDIDTFAILGHNLTAGASVKLEANISNNFAAPPFTINVAVDPESENIIIVNDGFGNNYEYYKLTILDPASPCGYIEIGRIVGGRAFTFDFNEDITDDYGIDNNDESETMKTQGFFRASNENVVTRRFSAQFNKISTVVGSDTNYKSFKKMFKNVKTTRPFLMILERDNPQVLNMWGQLTDLPRENFTINKFASFGISMEEVF